MFALVICEAKPERFDGLTVSVHHGKIVTILQIQSLNFEAFSLRPGNGGTLINLDLEAVGTNFSGRWYYLPSERVIGA